MEGNRAGYANMDCMTWRRVCVNGAGIGTVATRVVRLRILGVLIRDPTGSYGAAVGSVMRTTVRRATDTATALALS